MSKSIKIPIVDIICLTGGKCGSTTLKNTFIRNGYKCIKAHNEQCFKRQFKYDGLIDLINRSSSNKKLYLIDSYRTPIERKISSFFENISVYVPNYVNKSCGELIDIFNNKYLNNLEEDHSINPIIKKYGLDPFDTFDFKKKYVIKKKGNLVFIKILFSDIKQWGEILSKIFNKKIVLHNGNLSKHKVYNPIYNQFKKYYKIKKSYINNILKNDKEFRIFNTKKQQELYINKHLNSVKNYDFNFGFIILRHVRCKITNKYWINCYKCIRKYYPEIPIVIIDDNSNPKYLKNEQLFKTYIIYSEFASRGELLPYYYFSRFNFFDTAVIIHDSVFINDFIDCRSLLTKTSKFLWSFEHDWDQVSDEIFMIKQLNNEDVLKFYRDKSKWKGCFGGMSIIKHDYLKYIYEKHNMDSLMDCVYSRFHRSSFERVLGCILSYEQKIIDKGLLGNIHKYLDSVGLKWESPNGPINWNNKDNFNLPVVKIWTGR